jgi:hypothetical protein
MNSLRVSAAFIMILFLFSLLIYHQGDCYGSGSRSNTEDPIFSIGIDKEEAYVDVAPWTSGEINFTITINCQIPEEAPNGSEVELRLNLSAWSWGVSQIPIMFFNIEREEIEVEITVSAFINSSAETVVDLEIWGDWKYTNSTISGQIERFNAARIFVLPFYDLFIGSNNPVIYSDIGDWTEFSFNISNRANRDVNIILEIVKDNSHLKVDLPNGTLYMKKGETRTITLRVRQEPSRSSGNTIHVYATIMEDPDEKEWDLFLMYYTEPTFATFFYERNFLRLVIIIGVIILVAIGLFVWERTKKEEKKEEVDPEPGRRIRSPRSIDLYRK